MPTAAGKCGGGANSSKLDIGQAGGNYECLICLSGYV